MSPGVDADGSGVIDYTEFLAATLDRPVKHPLAMLKGLKRPFGVAVAPGNST